MVTEGVRRHSSIRFLESVYGLRLARLTDSLLAGVDSEKGSTYELDSVVREYYSSVHATVLFTMQSLGLLTPERTTEMRAALLRMRTPVQVNEEQHMVWDAVEGAGCFSVALSLYSLANTPPGSLSEFDGPIRWLLHEQNTTGIWPALVKGGPDCLEATFYVTPVLQRVVLDASLRKLHLSARSSLAEVKKALEERVFCWNPQQLQRRDGPTLSALLCALDVLRRLESPRLGAALARHKPAIDRLILNGQAWHHSQFGEVRVAGRRKRMNAYNPAYLPVLLRLGWRSEDPVVSKLLWWMREDLATYWDREGVECPWRSSDSIVQAFIASLTLAALRWSSLILLRQTVQPLIEAGPSAALSRDVFICHASEDKNEYVGPLKRELVRAGLSVWYDEGEIQWGDSIAKRLQDGIARSRFGIICLSAAFLEAGWPETEFHALLQRQQKERRKVLLPLILDSEQEVLSKYCFLRDLRYARWAEGPKELARKAARVCKRGGRFPRSES
jgi:hypothetical protein